MNVYIESIIKLNEDVEFSYTFDKYSIIGAADGHGGNGAAVTCKTHIRSILEKHLANSSDMKFVLQQVFSEIHSICKNLSCQSGCTLTIVIIDNETGNYTCGNVGDSHAMHIKSNSFMWITVSHRLQDNPIEREKLKGKVSYIEIYGKPSGPPRLFPGGLSCSRNIGDGDCEYVSCEPSLYSDHLENMDAIIICTDGIWDICNFKKIVNIVRDSYNPEFVCRLANKSALSDDATVVIATRQKLKTSLHTNLFKFFSRSGSNSSMSSEENESIVVKVPIPLEHI